MPRLKGLIFRHLPVLSWLPKYRVKENLLCDVVSGVSAGTIQVPQGQLDNHAFVRHFTDSMLSNSVFGKFLFSRHGFCPLGQPPTRQWSLLLFLPPHPLFFHGHSSPDGPR